MAGGAPVTELLAQLARAQARAEHHRNEAEQAVNQHVAKVDNGPTDKPTAKRADTNRN